MIQWLNKVLLKIQFSDNDMLACFRIEKEKFYLGPGLGPGSPAGAPTTEGEVPISDRIFLLQLSFLASRPIFWAVLSQTLKWLLIKRFLMFTITARYSVSRGGKMEVVIQAQASAVMSSMRSREYDVAGAASTAPPSVPSPTEHTERSGANSPNIFT